MRIKLPLHHLKEVVCELNLFPYPGQRLGDMQIKLLLHPLEELACQLNLCVLWSSRYYPETIPIQSVFCALIRGLLIQSAPLEFTLLSRDNTCLVCYLCSYPGFVHLIYATYRRALFGAHAIILRQYMFSLCFTLSSSVCSFNLRDLSLCALWSSRYYPKTILVQSKLCALIWGLLI